MHHQVVAGELDEVRFFQGLDQVAEVGLEQLHESLTAFLHEQTQPPD